MILHFITNKYKKPQFNNKSFKIAINKFNRIIIKFSEIIILNPNSKMNRKKRKSL